MTFMAKPRRAYVSVLVLAKSRFLASLGMTIPLCSAAYLVMTPQAMRAGAALPVPPLTA